MLAETSSMVLECGLEPDHGPVNVAPVFNLGSHELKEFEKKHFRHVSDDKRD